MQQPNSCSTYPHTPGQLYNIYYTPEYILYTKYILYIAWVGVSWQRRCNKTHQSPRELDSQPTVLSCFVLFFWRSPWLAVVLDHLCGVENLNSAQGETSYHVVFTGMARHPRGSYIVCPLLCLEVTTPETKSVNLVLPSACKKVCLKSGSQ